MNEEKYIPTSTYQLEQLLAGIQCIFDGLSTDMEWTLEAILERDHPYIKDKSRIRGANAELFLSEYYTVLQGACRTAAAALSIVNDAILAEDLVFQGGNYFPVKRECAEGGA